MTIDKAIEANKTIIKYPKTPIGLHTLDAIKLGIEALKQLRAIRQAHPEFKTFELPGETKD